MQTWTNTSGSRWTRKLNNALFSIEPGAQCDSDDDEQPSIKGRRRSVPTHLHLLKTRYIHQSLPLIYYISYFANKSRSQRCKLYSFTFSCFAFDYFRQTLNLNWEDQLRYKYAYCYFICIEFIELYWYSWCSYSESPFVLLSLRCRCFAFCRNRMFVILICFLTLRQVHSACDVVSWSINTLFNIRRRRWSKIDVFLCFRVSFIGC